MYDDEGAAPSSKFTKLISETYDDSVELHKKLKSLFKIMGKELK
jgi:hypothetical protein